MTHVNFEDEERARRALVKKGFSLWHEYAETWRVEFRRYVFYRDMQDKLRITQTRRPRGTYENTPIPELFYIVGEAEVEDYLESLEYSELSRIVSFTENAVAYNNCACREVTAWNYNFSQKLKLRGVNESYGGDILEHPEDLETVSQFGGLYVRKNRVTSTKLTDHDYERNIIYAQM